METVAKVRSGIEQIPGLEVVGDPIGPVLAVRSDLVDLFAVADVMDDRGWNLNRNTSPPGIHLMLSPVHADVVDHLLADLRFAVAHHGPSRGADARYS
jgi:glutamate/tyrosine decarboxylase-like PLP-dependent enzyme